MQLGQRCSARTSSGFFPGFPGVMSGIDWYMAGMGVQPTLCVGTAGQWMMYSAAMKSSSARTAFLYATLGPVRKREGEARTVADRKGLKTGQGRESVTVLPVLIS